jgi:dihydroorotate dehydrogenase electron transfer subunit
MERGVVTLREELMPGVWLVRLRSPQIAAMGLPGQFVHIQCAEGTDPLLRRPFSFCDINGAAGTYDILFNVVGTGTAILAAGEAGQAFEALGPLGHAFTLPQAGGRLLMIAGGLGVAPFPLVARAASEAGVVLRWANGAYTAHQLLPQAAMPELEAHPCTDDGSFGYHGFVTDRSAQLLDGVDMVHACGPTPMLIALARQVPPCEMSLEAPMGCALGTCLGCVVPSADGGYARVCVEGAVFDWRTLDWPRMATLGELVQHRAVLQRLPAEATLGSAG